MQILIRQTIIQKIAHMNLYEKPQIRGKPWQKRRKSCGSKKEYKKKLPMLQSCVFSYTMFSIYSQELMETCISY